MKKLWILLAVLTIGMAAASLAPHTTAEKRSKVRKTPNAIANRYIVVLDPVAMRASGDSSSSAADRLAGRYGADVEKVYSAAIQGFSAEMTAEEAERMGNDPGVLFIEQDQEVSVNTMTQTNPTWGLDRVDQRSVPLNTAYSYSYTGSGVNVYVVDTGIRPSHVEFGGRATADFDSLNDGQNGQDCHGHGTHVAGTIGGATYGVAKNVRLRGVRVLGCNGTAPVSYVIDGIDWVTANRVSPAIVNMSLGTGVPSELLDFVVNSSINSGLTYVVAAGNSGADACNVSPARVPNALTIGASDPSDNMAGWSNFGSCVDMFAPGVGILSAYSWSNTATNTISGTSMATPHVTGTAALFLESRPNATPADVRSELMLRATPGAMTGVTGGSPNLMVYTAPLGPTAGNAMFEGRVVTNEGRGLKNVRVTLQNGTTGEYSVALTNPFGYFRFEELETGVTYVATVNNKRYFFENSPYAFSLNDDFTDFAFVGTPR